MSDSPSLAGVLPHYRFKVDVYGVIGRVSHEAKVELADDSGGELRRLGGGANKDVFVNEKAAEVFIIASDANNPWVIIPIREQIAFYEKHKGNQVFQKTVVPLTKVLEDKDGNIVGMGQTFFGRGLDHFRATGGSLAPEEIVSFCEKYRELLASIKVAHGNLLAEGKLNGDQIRIDLQTRELRFVDYYPNGGILEIAHQSYRPGDPDYETVMNMDPERLRSALHEYFGFSDRGAGNGSV